LDTIPGGAFPLGRIVTRVLDSRWSIREGWLTKAAMGTFILMEGIAPLCSFANLQTFISVLQQEPSSFLLPHLQKAALKLSTSTEETFPMQ